MPELPTFLAKRAERWFGVPSTVTEVEPLSPRFRRVRFAGEALKRGRWQPGYAIEFRVHGARCAIIAHRPSIRLAGIMDVLFFLHGQGPGSAWAAGLAPGQSALVMGPGADGLGLIPGSDWHLFLGEETALGALHALSGALPPNVPVLGAVEVAAGEAATIAPFVPRLQMIAHAPAYGDALLAWLDSATLPAGRGAVYLIGHAQSIQRLRERLVLRGIERRQIKTKPFWSDGKRGL